MRQKITQLSEEAEFQLVDYQRQSLTTNSKNKSVYHWSTAPNTEHFVGREEEIKKLDLWSQQPDCRCIVISGMVGCGKTLLATKFARNIKNRFDSIIWVSLLQTPSLRTLLNNYLKLINQRFSLAIEPEYSELNFLLSEFIDCLKNQKILLILDGLQCILQMHKNNVFFNPEFEDYAQFLSSIISTNHQSLLITTSGVKPKMLNYYGSNKINFLELQGFKSETTRTLLNVKTNISLDDRKLSFFSQILQDNPQFLQIVNNHLDYFSGDNLEQIAEDISLLEAIINLLESELSCLSDLEQEIIYWLAISDYFSLEGLSHQIEKSKRKLYFLQSINNLVSRSLVIENDSKYALMPIMKIYLRRKLVNQALDNHHT